MMNSKIRWGDLTPLKNSFILSFNRLLKAALYAFSPGNHLPALYVLSGARVSVWLTSFVRRKFCSCVYMLVSGGFYRAPEAKVVFCIRIKGINKLAPKPKMILQLFRLRQLHNGVFIRVNKATMEMLQAVQPFVTYGYPSLSTVRKLIYKRGYGAWITPTWAGWA